MLLDKEKSCLVIVDVQEKLTPKVVAAKAFVEKTNWLMRLASELDVPILVCEQYPKGLGSTIAAIKDFLPTQQVFEKLSFSAYRDPNFQQALAHIHRKQVVLVGIETHVCILQTALDLQSQGHQVYVVSDAVSARHAYDHQVALDRMRQLGVQIMTAEMVFYEWIKDAGTPMFKALNQAFIMKMD